MTGHAICNERIVGQGRPEHPGIEKHEKKRKKIQHIATRTIWFAVLSSFVLGLASLMVGLYIYSNSLMQESVSRTRSTTSRAASSAQNGTDTVGLAADVMRVYNSLTPEQLSEVGTE